MVDLLFMLKSRFTLEVRGEEPQRFLNRAAAKGIYISEVKPIEGGLRVVMSRQARDLMAQDMPPGLTLKPVREHGAPKLLRKFKGRWLLLAGLPLAAAHARASEAGLGLYEGAGSGPRRAYQRP